MLMLAIAMAVLVGIAGVAAVIAVAATPVQVRHANQTAAVSAAAQMLGEVVLPAGSNPVPSEPAGDEYLLAHPFEVPIFAAEVDRHEFWTTTASPKAVIASFEANLPAGAQRSPVGYSGPKRHVCDLLAADRRRADARSAEHSASTRSSCRTGPRESERMPRFATRRRVCPTQRIPPQARVLDVTEANSHSSPLLSLTVHQPRAGPAHRVDRRRSPVRRVVARRGVLVPGLDDRADRHVYLPGVLDGPALAQVTEPSDWPTIAEPCFITTLSIRGHREPGLLEGGKLLRGAGAILGVKLTTRP